MEDNKQKNKGKFKEKKIFTKKYDHSDNEKKRMFECIRSNWNLVILGKRWDEKYNNYSLIPTSRWSVGYEDGSIALDSLLKEAILDLTDRKITPDDFGKEIYNEGLLSSKGQSFKIVIKVGTSGDVKMFFQVEDDKNKDIILIEDQSGIQSDLKTPYYVRILERFRSKLNSYTTDFESTDKFNFAMIDKEAGSSTTGTGNTTKDEEWVF